MNTRDLYVRIVIGASCFIGLVLIFIFQRFDVVGWVGIETGNPTRFILNRSIRFALNDMMAIGLIFALFYERKYVIFAVVVQLIGMFLFLVPYFILKVQFPGYNGPLISFLHRLVLNPTLLLLLIPAFYFQRRTQA